MWLIRESHILYYTSVAEQADARDLKSPALYGRTGSNPVGRTNMSPYLNGRGFTNWKVAGSIPAVGVISFVA